MNISRGFLLMGAVYLVVGVGFGMYMGGSGDHTLAPVHAHINLLGFTLMTIFGLAYRLIPSMAEGMLAQAHFWLHQVGALILLVGLFLMFSGNLAESTAGMIFPVAEILVMAGIFCWLTNVFRKA